MSPLNQPFVGVQVMMGLALFLYNSPGGSTLCWVVYDDEEGPRIDVVDPGFLSLLAESTRLATFRKSVVDTTAEEVPETRRSA